MPGIKAFLLVASALACVGLYGALSQQSIVMVMMGFELMIAGALLAVVSLWYFVAAASAEGQVFAIVVLTLMAVDAALGFALVVALYRARRIDVVDSASSLRG